MSIKYWSIRYWDSGAGIWVIDSRIPRAGLEAASRTKEATISFIELAEGSIAKLSSEEHANWQEIVLVFPRKVVTEALKSQFEDYIDNEKGVKIEIPISSGASSYVSTSLKGYFTRYAETWELTGDPIEFTLRLTLREFNVDNA